MTLSDLPLLVSAACCLRLLAYRRRGARFRRHISALAYLLILLTGGLSLALLTGQIAAADIHPLCFLALCMLTAATWYTGGNVAHLIRILTGGNRWT